MERMSNMQKVSDTEAVVVKTETFKKVKNPKGA